MRNLLVAALLLSACAASPSKVVKYGGTPTPGPLPPPTTVTLTDGATINIDCSRRVDYTVTLGGNRTFTTSNILASTAFMLEVVQDGTGSRTATWPASFHWAAGTAPTLTTTAGQADVVSCKSFNGTSLICVANANFAP